MHLLPFPPLLFNAQAYRSTELPMFTLQGYVMVAGDISPYRNSEGGSGRITAISGAGADQTVNVKYTLTNTTEKDIPICRLTTTPMPYHDLATPTRSACKPVVKLDSSKYPIKTLPPRGTLIERLHAARGSRKHERLGWLRDDDAQHEGKVLTVMERRDRTLKYALQLKSYVQGKADEKGVEVKAYTRHDSRCSDGNFGIVSSAISQVDVPKGELSKRFLCWAMGNRSTSSLIKWTKNDGKDGRAAPVCKKPRRGLAGLSVIDDKDWAAEIFTAKRLYLDHEVGSFINGSDDFFTAEDKAAERKRKEIEWDTAVIKDTRKMVLWDCKRRNHLERQPHIRTDLVTQLLANSCTSFEGLAESIGYWCSVATIKKWLHSFDTFGIYRKEIKPGLTPGITCRSLWMALLVFCLSFFPHSSSFLLLHFHFPF
jgi:hypothetical protein